MKRLIRITGIITAIWLIAQVVLVCIYWDYPLTGDSIIYEGTAMTSYNNDTWYPKDLNSIIVAEPLVNSLIAQLRLFGTLNTNKILNLLMNIGILLSVFIIAKKLFNERIAYISAILFCLIYSNTLIVIGTRTEIPFVFFLLLSFALLKPKWINVILAGLFMGMAEWYRPLMPVFIPGMIIYMFYERFDKKYYLGFFVSLAIAVAGIGLFNYHQTGKYFINPSTGGANLFMTANDKASGATATHLLNDPEVAPEMPDEFNELQRDSVYKAAAVDWIKKHPVKYATLYVKKIVGLYIEDSWPDRAIMHNSGQLSVYITNKDYSSIFGMAILMVAKSLVYYIVLLLFFISVIKNRKDLLSSKGSIVLTVILSTLATCLFVVSPTYHYPMMFAIIIWAAYEIEKRLESKKYCKNMKVVLLAGGFGSRISEESVFKPKPMIEIGGMPILWHIMKEYAYYGHNEFIICAGYKQEYIKEWFANYFLHNSDVSFDFRDGKNEMTVHHSKLEPWKVTVVDTGYNTMTGGRIKRVQEYVGNETFMMTYGDGVCDVDINKLVEFHKSHGKIATLTAVKMAQEKGVLDIVEGAVKSFREKNANDGAPINAGYMVLEPAIFDLLDGDSCIFERKPLETLAKQGELMSYIHEGFWQCMDNIREKNLLDKLLQEGKAPWKKWDRQIPKVL